MSRTRSMLVVMLSTVSYGCSHTYKLGSLSQAAVQARVHELAENHELRTELSPGLWAAVTVLPDASIVRPLPHVPGIPQEEAETAPPSLRAIDRVDNHDISLLRFANRPRGVLQGLAFGLLSGLVAGGTLGYVNYQSRPDPPPFGGCIEFCGASGEALTVAKYAAYGALAGGLLGAAIGAIIGDRTTLLFDR